MSTGARRHDPTPDAGTTADPGTRATHRSQTIPRLEDEPSPPTTHAWLDRAVPVRRRASADGAPLRAAFLLSHVDDRMTVAELAACAQIPLADAIEAFVLLADLGLVELRAPSLSPKQPDGGDRPPTPKSGLHPKNG